MRREKADTLVPVRRQSIMSKKLNDCDPKAQRFEVLPCLAYYVLDTNGNLRESDLHTVALHFREDKICPRGCVAWNVNKFIVLVGKWAEPIQDELTELLGQEVFPALLSLSMTITGT